MDDRPGPKKHLALRLILVLVQVAILIGVVYFVWKRAGTLLADFRVDDIRGHEGWLALSALLYAAFYGVVAWHWQLAGRQVDRNAHPHLWIGMFASQPFKYLPSGLFTFSFRAKYAHDLGLPLKQSTKAQVIESVNLIGSALVLSGILFAFGYDLVLGLATGGLIGAAVVGGLLIRGTVRVPKFGQVPVRREMQLLLIATLAWVVAGAAFAAALSALGSSIGLAAAIAVNSLAFAVGLLAVFAPGGLGVREAIFAANDISNPPIVLWRLVTLVVDAVTGSIAILIVHRLKRRRR